MWLFWWLFGSLCVVFNNVVYLLLFVCAYFVVLVGFVLLMWVYTARDFGDYCWRYCLRICLFVSRRAGFGFVSCRL